MLVCSIISKGPEKDDYFFLFREKIEAHANDKAII
jgi:hypothetical protein